VIHVALPARGRPGRATMALVLAAAAWGTGTVVAKRAVAEIPALTLLAIQLGASIVVLAVLMRARRIPLTGSGGSSLLGRLGILNPGLAYALSLLGLAHIGASVSVLLWAMEPILILLLAAWLLSERVRPLVLVLSVLALAGVLLVAARSDTGSSALAIGLTAAGVVCCAIYTIVTRRWIATSDATAPVVLAQQAHALLVALIVVGALAISGAAVVPAGISAIGWTSAIGSGVLYYAVAYWLYLSALREVPASLASASFYLVPVFGLGASFAFLGELLDPAQWIGTAVVAIAVLGILRETTFRAGPSDHGEFAEVGVT
jgi:probable blue pigment (indigoidine) exporter